MKLTNFKLESEVELSGLAQWWDLHNCVDFAGLVLLPDEGAARMRWTVLPERPQGFCETNPATSCAIRFDGVSAILVRRVAEDVGGEGRTLDEVGLVAPQEATPMEVLERGARLRSTDESARMLFSFMAGFDIEIAAESATLEADG